MRIKLLCAMALLLGSCAKDSGETNPNTESDAQVVGFTMTKADTTLEIPETYRFTVWYSATTACYGTGTYVPATSESGVSYMTPCKVEDATGEEVDSSDPDKWLTSNGLQMGSTTQNLYATRPATNFADAQSVYPVQGGTIYKKIIGYDIYRKDSKQFFLGMEESVEFEGFSFNNLKVLTFAAPLKEQRATITLKIKSKDENESYDVTSIKYYDIPKQVRYHPYYGHYVDYSWLEDYELVKDADNLIVNYTEAKNIISETPLTDEENIPLTDTDGKFNLLALDYTSEYTYAVVPYIEIHFVSNSVESTVTIPLYRDFTPQLNYVATLSITSIYATLSIEPTQWDTAGTQIEGTFNENEFTEITVSVSPEGDGSWDDGGDITGTINDTEVD